MAPKGQAGSGTDAGAPPAAHGASSTKASPERSTNETNTDDADTRDDHETDSAEDDRTTRDPMSGVTQVVNRTPKVAESRGKSDSNIEWTALLNLLVKKRLLTHEEVQVEIELLKRNKSRL